MKKLTFSVVIALASLAGTVHADTPDVALDATAEVAAADFQHGRGKCIRYYNGQEYGCAETYYQYCNAQYEAQLFGSVIRGLNKQFYFATGLSCY